MTLESRPHVIQNYEELKKEIKEQLKLIYPAGYVDHLMEHINSEGELISVLPFETDEVSYLIPMSMRKAMELIDNDSDFDEDGILLASRREKYQEKYSDMDYLYDEEE